MSGQTDTIEVASDVSSRYLDIGHEVVNAAIQQVLHADAGKQSPARVTVELELHFGGSLTGRLLNCVKIGQYKVGNC